MALLLALMAGCDHGSAPREVVFGASGWLGCEPVYLSRDLGYLSASNIRLAEFHSASEVRQAFRHGALQLAAVTLEDALLLRRDIPDLKIVLIFSSAKLPATGNRTDVLVTRDDYIGDYHREMVQLLDAWRRALDYIHADPAKASAAMAQHAHLAAAEFDQAMHNVELFDLQRNRDLLGGQDPSMAGRIESTQRLMMGKGMLSVGVDPSMLLDASLLAGVAK